MANESKMSFEIPAEMRAFAEKSMEQARLAFDGFITAAQAATSTADRRVAGARAGAKELGDLAMHFAERNIASSFDFAQRLLQAKDAEEMLALQTEYVKSQIETLSEQAKKLGKEAGRMAE